MRLQSLALTGVSLAALSGLTAPAALCGPVRAASSDVATAFAELNTAFTDFKERNDGKITALTNNFQAALDDLGSKIAAGRLAGSGGGPDLAPPDPEYSKTFASYFRTGDDERELKDLNATGRRAEVRAAMSIGTDSAGGYLAPVEWDRRVNKALISVSPMRRLAAVVPTTVRAYTSLWQQDGIGSGWVGETASRPATSTPTLQPIVYPNGEIYAFPMITQQLLDDADFKLEEWLASEVETEFATQEGIAFISGNGVNKPRGLLTYVDGGASAGIHPGGNLVTVPTGAAADLGDPDKLIDFVYSLPAPYRQNAKWLMNSLTAAALAKLKDGDGNYLWRETYVAGQPATLLGYPVEIDENMPMIAAGALPIAFGDFQRGYTINDRLGIQVLRDALTNKPFVGFYTRKRVGGGVSDPKAIRLLRVAVS